MPTGGLTGGLGLDVPLWSPPPAWNVQHAFAFLLPLTQVSGSLTSLLHPLYLNQSTPAGSLKLFHCVAHNLEERECLLVALHPIPFAILQTTSCPVRRNTGITKLNQTKAHLAHCAVSDASEEGVRNLATG